jgi:hypothetical protein
MTTICDVENLGPSLAGLTLEGEEVALWRSTVFIFVTVLITSLYNGSLKNGNFVVKIYRCFIVKTDKISKATW